jgi:hypothetical protein
MRPFNRASVLALLLDHPVDLVLPTRGVAAMAQRLLFLQMPGVDHVHRRAVAFAEAGREVEHKPVQPLPRRVAQGFGIDRREDRVETAIPGPHEHPDRAGAFAQEVHVEALEDPASVGCRRGALDDDVMAFALHHADDLDEGHSLKDRLGHLDACRTRLCRETASLPR